MTIQNNGNAPLPARTNLFFRVVLQGQTVIEDSPLGVAMGGTNGNFVENLRFKRQTARGINQLYRPIGGKRSIQRNFANEKTLTFLNPEGRTMELIFRAYNDGIAYRYRFPGTGAGTILREESGFKLPDGSRAWLQPPAQIHNYESEFISTVTGSDSAKGLWAFQALFELPQNRWVLLLEAEVIGSYVPSYLTVTGEQRGLFRLHQPVREIQSQLPWQTPWRGAIIATNLPALVDSSLVENLNPPSRIRDVRWIKPGRVAWSWWYDRSTVTKLGEQKSLVDFASEMGWEYLLLDEGTDVVWMPELIQYATAKKIGVLFWTHWRELDTAEKRAQKFSLFKSWGIKGIKVDYIDGLSQDKMAFYEQTLEAAAAQQLLVNFHGANLPTGLRRTWPNLMTSEAVKATEYYPRLTAGYHTLLPFTRNILGPMDFTPGVVSENRPTSVAHQMALTVLYDSSLQHFPDAPSKYVKVGVTNFLRHVPAHWEETRLIDGYPGEFVIMARRKGRDWFAAGITGESSWNLNIPLKFLTAGKFLAEIYREGENGDTVIRETRAVTPSGNLPFALPPGSGFVIRFTRTR